MPRNFRMNPYAIGPGGGPGRYFTEIEELTDLPEDIEILPADLAEQRYITKHRGAPSYLDDVGHMAKYPEGTTKHIVSVRGLPIPGGKGAYAVGEYEDVKAGFMDAAGLPRGPRTKRKHGAVGYSYDTRVFPVSRGQSVPFLITFVSQDIVEGATPGGYSNSEFQRVARLNLRGANKKADIDREVGRLLQQGNYVGTQARGGEWRWQKPLTEASVLDFEFDDAPSPAAAAPSGRAGKVHAKAASPDFRNIDGVDFTGADLSGKHIQVAGGRGSAVGAIFKNAEAEGTTFSRMNLSRASFRGANLADAKFENCNLEGANFAMALLDNTEFIRCTFDGQSDFSKAQFQTPPKFSSGTDLSHVKGAAHVAPHKMGGAKGGARQPRVVVTDIDIDDFDFDL